MLSLVPMLREQRDLYDIPRGWSRFQRYLDVMTGGTDDLALPLPAFNPMGRDHVAAALDALLAVGAEEAAREALVEAAERLGCADVELRVGLVLADDVGGGWTDRESIEANRLRFVATPMLKRKWLVVVLWSSQPASRETMREEVLATVYRELSLLRNGLPRTLRELMLLEGMALAFAGAAAPSLEEEDLAYTREVIRPHLDSRAFEDFPTVFACLYGDEAARRLGHPPLGLSPRAGCALALAEAREVGVAPEAVFSGEAGGAESRFSSVARSFLALVLLIAGVAFAPAPVTADPDPVPAPLFDVVEERVATFSPPGNGAGPLWCYGAPLVARRGEEVWVSVAETGDGVPPLSNTRWRVLRRTGSGWEPVAEAEGYREREPCPIAVLPGRVFVSANTSTAPPGTWYGPTQPGVWAIATGAPGADAGPPGSPRSPGAPESPVWDGQPNFTDHSYRGFAADAERGELLLLHIDARTSEQHVSWRDAGGAWRARGSIAFPIRAAYPQVALRRGAAHVLAIGDIVEPRAEWRELKKERTGRDWDYVFRRLFYAWTPSIAETPFAAPVEVATTERTCGHITNLDLWLDGSGRAHLLWLERPHLHGFIRDRYFPGEPMTSHLRHAVLDEGRVVSQRTLAETPPDGHAGFEPRYGRFHVTPDGGLHVIASGRWLSERGDGPAGLAWVRLARATEPLRFRRIPLERPLGVFFTATPRGGSTPSWTVDLFGSAGGDELRYARFRLPREGRVISEEGCGRATGYAEANRIVTRDGLTHVAWLDSTDDGFLARVRTIERSSGEASPPVTLGAAHDNHGAPALAVDSRGHLHAVWGPHHHPMRYRRSSRPNDASAWDPEETVGERATYPTLVCGPDDTLYLTCRESRDREPWVVNLYTRAPGEAWRGPRTIVASEHEGYSHFQEALAWGPDHRTLHLSTRIYGGSPRRGHTVGYLRSEDGGRTWTRADGTPVALPATAATIDVIAEEREGPGVGLRSGAIAVDRENRPWVLYSSSDAAPFEAWIATPVADGRWRRESLRAGIAGRDLGAWGLTLPGGLVFGAEGELFVAITLIRPEDLEDSTLWGHPSSEIALLHRKRGAAAFTLELISPPDPNRAHWLPSIERPTGHHAVEIPTLLYTDGPRGESNSDRLSNRVLWVDPAGG